MQSSKSKSKTPAAKSVIAASPKKPQTKPAKTSAKRATSRLGGAAPYLLPGVGALATAGLAATAFVLRKNIASFARDKSETGLQEMLQMLHLERRSMHVFGALGVFAGGLALGCLAGFFFIPRLVSTATDAVKGDASSLTDGVMHERPRSNSVVQPSS